MERLVGVVTSWNSNRGFGIVRVGRCGLFYFFHISQEREPEILSGHISYSRPGREDAVEPRIGDEISFTPGEKGDRYRYPPALEWCFKFLEEAAVDDLHSQKGLSMPDSEAEQKEAERAILRGQETQEDLREKLDKVRSGLSAALKQVREGVVLASRTRKTSYRRVENEDLLPRRRKNPFSGFVPADPSVFNDLN